MATAKKIRVTQTKSSNGRLQSHKATLTGLGLRRIRHTVEVEDTAEVRGMLNKVNYMIRVED
jgi:large subunit ribosomal protein L30